MPEPPVARVSGRAHRLIASRFPPLDVFADVASPEDARAALELEMWTNDRITAVLARASRLPSEEWVVGRPDANWIMAAFLHPAPGGGRFNTDALGAWYAAFEIETEFAETVHHHVRRLRHSAAGFRQRIQMRELVVELDAALHDVRPWRNERPELYDPDSYAISQPFGEALRRAGSNGIAYESVRRAGGRNAAAFRPRLLPAVLQGNRFEYVWTGTPEPAILKIAGVT